MRERNLDADVLTSVLDDVFCDIRSRVGRLDPLPLQSVRATFKDLSRSAGICFDGHYKTKKEIPDSELVTCVDALKTGSRPIPPCKVGFRSQVRRHQAKRRIIFVAPGPFVMVEKMFWHPLQQAMASTACYGWWNVNFDWFKSGGDKFSSYCESDAVYSTDFEDFDLCPSPQLIEAVMIRFGQLFDMNEEQVKIWKGITKYYVAHPIKYKEEVLISRGGIASGVAGTHVLGTTIGRVLMCYVFQLLGEPLPDSQHYGDDCFLRGTLSLQELISAVSKYTTFSLSKTKSKSGVYWLGFKWKANRWILQDRDKRWAQLFLPERKHSFVARLQALLLNCLSDPIRFDVIKILRDWKELEIKQETIDILGLDDLFVDKNYQHLTILEFETVLKRNHRL